jgi:opacity protein-like surface antigen
MKTTRTLLLIAALIAAVKLNAQEAPVQKWLSDSSRAFQFGVSGNFTLMTFDGKSISFKQQLTPTRAIRVGVSFSGTIDQWGEWRQSYINDSLAASSNDTHGPSLGLALSLSTQYLWYVNVSERFFPYLGMGPIGSYSRTCRSYSSSTDKNEAWSLGAAGTAGIECFVYSRISLHAEYQAFITFNSTHGSSTSVYNSSGGRSYQSSNTWERYWNLSAQKVVFGLSVYF